MILFVAWTGPPFDWVGMRVAELVMDEREVEEEFVYAVEPLICELLEIVWLKPLTLLEAALALKTGAVFVLESGG